jgi:hypothetical protein
VGSPLGWEGERGGVALSVRNPLLGAAAHQHS